MPKEIEFKDAADPNCKIPETVVSQKDLLHSAHNTKLNVQIDGTPEVLANKRRIRRAVGERAVETQKKVRKPWMKVQTKSQELPTIVGREPEYKEIERQLLSFANYGNSSILYITGVPGSGKTYTTANVLNYLGLSYCYINCSGLKKKSAIYRAIGGGFSCIKGNATLQSLRFHFNSCCEGHILVIDEVDFLWNKKETLLYNLFELPFFGDSKIFMIVISNSLGALSTKIESRIGENRMEFRPYSAKQLKSVVESEFQGMDISEKSIELITKRIAASTGDIRRVKEVVENVGHRDLNTVNGFLKDISAPLINKFLTSFNFYQKMLVFLHKQSTKTIEEWFDSHRSFCTAKNYKPLDFADFLLVVNDLVEFGVYKIKKDGLEAVCNYVEEELDAASRDDRDFIGFAKSSR